jgi:hypothetical protein
MISFSISIPLSYDYRYPFFLYRIMFCLNILNTLPLLSIRLLIQDLITAGNLIRISDKLVHESSDFKVPLLFDCVLFFTEFESVGDIDFKELWQHSINNLWVELYSEVNMYTYIEQVFSGKGFGGNLFISHFRQEASNSLVPVSHLLHF